MQARTSFAFRPLLAGVLSLALAGCGVLVPVDYTAQADEPLAQAASKAEPVARAPSASPQTALANPASAQWPVQRCMNVGSALEAPVEGEWGHTLRARDFTEIAKAGFDTVRIPIKWSAHAGKNAPYAIDPVFLSRVDQVVQQALDAGLNAIIDVHHYDEVYRAPDRHLPRVLGLWRQLAEHYRAWSPKLIFEPFNEPRDKFVGKKVQQFNRDVLALIRETNPQRWVILSGDAYGTLAGVPTIEPIDDPFAVATVHYYDPFEFTHGGAVWLKDAPPAGRGFPLPGDIEALDQDVRHMLDQQRRIGRPLFVGEFGTDANVAPALRARWARTLRVRFEQAGLSWCFFNFAAGFASYDVASERWIDPILPALIDR